MNARCLVRLESSLFGLERVIADRELQESKGTAAIRGGGVLDSRARIGSGQRRAGDHSSGRISDRTTNAGIEVVCPGGDREKTDDSDGQQG